MPSISKAFIDTNIWLDIILERPEFVAESNSALVACIDQDIQLLCAATSLTDVFYLAAKSAGSEAAYKALGMILGVSEIAQVDGDICRKAIGLERPDYEDGVIAACALAEEADVILTRDENAFRELDIKKYSPKEFIKLLGFELVGI